jgi:ElaB/YqjD/DUF883 family membrane-anchored ribosome-binding protein
MREAGGRFGGDGGFRKDVDAIKDDIAMLKTDLGAAMRDLIGAGRSGADDARKRLQEIVSERLDSLNQAAENLSERGRKTYRDVKQHVEEHPTQTIGIALAIGAVIGLLYFGLRSRD